MNECYKNSGCEPIVNQNVLKNVSNILSDGIKKDGKLYLLMPVSHSLLQKFSFLFCLKYYTFYFKFKSL